VYKVHFLCAELRQTQTQVVDDNRKRVAITPRLHVREIPKQDTQTSRQYSPVVTGEGTRTLTDVSSDHPVTQGPFGFVIGDLEWDELEKALESIRHESHPTPPLYLGSSGSRVGVFGPF
jgi:hypothetical protein